MHNEIKHVWLWLSLIAGSFVALALGVTFVPEVLNQPLGDGPATWGLLASAAYLVFVIGLMGLAIRPFARSQKKAKR